MRLRAERPINAGAPKGPVAAPEPPAADTAAAKPDPKPADPPQPPDSPPQKPPQKSPQKSPQKPPQKAAGQPKRRRISPTLLALAATALVAVGIVIVAVVLGSGSGGGEATPGASPPRAPTAPAPSPAAPAAEASARLGFPASATRNTTRVSGGDPAAVAAGVALAAFPSTAPSLRPAAVTLADEASWQGAVAAAVLAAAPIRAPLLLASGDSLPDPTAAALAALQPQGSGATNGNQAFAIGGVEPPPELLRVKRLGAGSPATVAAAVARLRDQLFGTPPEHLIVASSADPGFAAPAAAWAARSGDPVLFTARDRLPGATAAALRRDRDAPVYVLGPPAAVSENVFRAIARIAGRVRRVAGADPVTNAIALARYADGDFGWNINDPGHGFVIARSDAPLEAAAAAPLSASGTWGPLLLTDSAATLPAALRGYLLDVKPGYRTDPTRAFYNHVWVIGDEEEIDVNQQGQIDELAELTQIGAAR